ncbi:VOC family protein [Sphingobium ummariense]
MVPSIPNFIGRTFDQICFVVEDMDEAVEYWKRTFGVVSWTVRRGLSRGQKDKLYRGKPGNFEYSCAYGVAGGIMVELAQHEEGVSAYSEWTDAGRTGPNHIGFRVDDHDAYVKACEHFEALGLEPVMSGLYEGDGGICRWGYYDTSATLGCFTEVYYLTGELLVEMARMQSEAADLSSAAPVNPAI